ncbi:MAG: ABC transporter permease [Candidatus Methanomethylophilaceae archaeon]|nr:ABC transporter permease [Candidatus Methanomethylophilaceae archaeon]NLF33644.1 ABC transporter permease [Thermoplasmatales archaeon]
MRPRAVVAAFKQQAIHFISDPQWIIPSILSPLLFTAVMLMLYRDLTGPVVLQAVLGGGVLGMWANTLFSSSYSISFDRYNGTLEPLLLSPSEITDIVAGRALWNALIGLSNALLVFLVSELVFHTEVSLLDPVMFFLTLVLTLVSLAVIGILLSTAFVLSRMGSVVASMAEYPIYVLSGALVPITILPSGLQYISYALPPTWGVDAVKLAAVEGYQSMMGADMLVDIAMVILLTVLYFLIARFLLKRIERRILETGSSTVY